VVAIRTETGQLVWSFQTVHHDVWDYDLPAQPTLARIDTGGGLRDVVIQPTKQGLLFVIDCDTGQPVWPVEERAVPQGGAEGEVLSPTQPFPTHVPDLMPQRFTPDDALNFPPIIGNPSCKAQLAPLRNDGALHTAFDTRLTGVSDERRRHQLGRRGLRSRPPDPLRQHQLCNQYHQADARARTPTASSRPRAPILARRSARPSRCRGGWRCHG
jgi:hypothetical protein